MSVVKVIELIGESQEGWEDATRLCVAEAAKTIHNIKSVWVHEMQAMVEGERIAKYRVNCKVSFVVDEKRNQSR